jgi:hypothetical protein
MMPLSHKDTLGTLMSDRCESLGGLSPGIGQLLLRVMRVLIGKMR